MRFDCRVGAINLCEVSEMKTEAIKAAVVRFLKDEEGLTVVEYAVAGGLISLAVVAGFTALGGGVCEVIADLTTAIGGTPAACS